MQKSWIRAVVTLSIAASLAAGVSFFSLRPHAEDARPPAPRWLSTGRWAFNIISSTNSNLWIPYQLYGVNEPPLSVTSLDWSNKGFALTSMTVNSPSLLHANTRLYQIDLSGRLTRDTLGEHWSLNLGLNQQRQPQSLGIAWIKLVSPASGFVLLTAAASTIGAFDPSDVYSQSIQNATAHDIRILGLRQAGAFTLSDLSYSVGQSMPQPIPKDALPLPSVGLVVLPGETVSLYVNISQFGAGVRSVIFQPALIEETTGSRALQPLSVAAWVYSPNSA